MEKLSSIGQFEWLRNRILSKTTEDKSVVHVCMTGCRAYGAAAVKDALVEEVNKQGLSETVEIRSTGCHGFCAKAPVVGLEPLGIQYQEVAPEDAPEITGKTLKENQLIERLAYKDPKTNVPIYHLDQIPFYAKQEKRVLKKCGRIDPTSVEDYIAAGGYQAIVKALTKMSPDEVIDEVLSAGIRGREGAGFPTGLKCNCG